MSEKFYIEFGIQHEGSELVLQPYDTPDAAVTAWFALERAWDTLWLLRVRDNIIEYYAEVYAPDSWVLMPEVQP